MSYDIPHVAYFCMEYGLSETFPIYSGGLGVLAGDFIRSAAALELPVVAVGIVWADGYTTQRIGPTGLPEDLPTPLDRSVLIREAPTVHVTIGGREVPLAIYRVEAFANAPLYLLEPTEPEDRWITRRLYGGGKADRIAQEIVLGVGGVRALEALEVPVDVYHFNEGHALFAGLELMSRARERGLDFEAARQEVREQIVFTTHTPVDAGNEQHDIEQLVELGANLGLSPAELAELGGDPFNMTVACLRLSVRANAVAELHGETASRMWENVEDAAPIYAITNGVNPRTWQDERVCTAGDEDQIGEAHAACKAELCAAVAARTGIELREDRLLVGFARRATAYKRALLLFHDPARAEALFADGRVQILYAGKSHPADSGGRELVAELVKLSARYPGAVTFLANYDLALGRLLTRGCDIWLNNPRRPLEACGTSGMKAAMNGVLNVSILDGWWPEGCEHGVNGWQIGEAVDYADPVAGDAADAHALYELFERQVIPTYYGDPLRWQRMMRASVAMSESRFSSDRMVRDYFEQLYAEALWREERKLASGG